MPTIRDLREKFGTVEDIRYPGGSRPEELAAAIVNATREFRSLRDLVGDIIGYLEQAEGRRNDFIRPDPASHG